MTGSIDHWDRHRSQLTNEHEQNLKLDEIEQLMSDDSRTTLETNMNSSQIASSLPVQHPSPLETNGHVLKTKTSNIPGPVGLLPILVR
jgi:hypothetical protein